ncbi:Sodium-potassium/proton antiporter ChaA [Austwickia sp. TVS 96-490-7B]|uniref:calcium:proton antiporter n=1 Tax=Austwickia sp. TVS 96-490-7B TaxID=2830843 RepID=UPI001C5972D4|nr:ionic transporter y4hA [Austwickia sp. TVS 96-490-7B]MBW3084184.1 Sodium-potassium/proton antiporter ChaA [Austwickia sp. TVS 96-490-7B]
MDQRTRSLLHDWTFVVPLVGIAVLTLAWGRALPWTAILVVTLALGGSVIAAVHHAEVVAHKVGEPYGSLVLAVAVTVIEVGLIVSLMSAGGEGAAVLARDTVFSAVMLTLNGIVGLSLLMGAVKHDIVSFNAEGAGAALATVLTLATLCLVLPTFTTAEPGPRYSGSQLAFAAVSSLVLYAVFVLTQTGRHRDFFLPVNTDTEDTEQHADPPTATAAWTSLALLLVCLVAVVGLAKAESPAIEAVVRSAGLPHSFVGVVIAMLVLAPETLAAVQAARRDRMQISFNLGLGSAMASIGLTIPVIGIASTWFTEPLHLGLDSLQMALLAITGAVTMLTIVPGRATRLQGGVHLALLAAFVFLAANP